MLIPVDIPVFLSHRARSLLIMIMLNLLFSFNRYRRKRPKVDESIFDSPLSRTRRSDASEKREENSVSGLHQINPSQRHFSLVPR